MDDNQLPQNVNRRAGEPSFLSMLRRKAAANVGGEVTAFNQRSMSSAEWHERRKAEQEKKQREAEQEERERRWQREEAERERTWEREAEEREREWQREGAERERQWKQHSEEAPAERH